MVSINVDGDAIIMSIFQMSYRSGSQVDKLSIRKT